MSKFLENLKEKPLQVKNYYYFFTILSKVSNSVLINDDGFDIWIYSLEYPLFIIAKNGTGKTRFLKKVFTNSGILKCKQSIYLNEFMVLSFSNGVNNEEVKFFEEFLNVYKAHSMLSTLNNKGFLTKYIWNSINEVLKSNNLPFSLLPSDLKSDRLLFKMDDVTLYYHDLSSGEKTLFIVFALIVFYQDNYSGIADEEVLLLLDEIETTLHAQSLRVLFNAIHKQRNNLKIIMSTHNSTSLRIASE